MNKIRIWVGCPANNEDLECQAVFAHSLYKHHPNRDDIELTWMMLSREPTSPWYSERRPDGSFHGWNTTGWATPFSPLRWGIPFACGFEGRAIYNDCDQIWMDDVQKLWDQPIPDDKALLMVADGAACVILMDCKRMQKLLPPFDHLRGTAGLYRQVRRDISKHAAPFAGDWNCRDGKGHSTIYDGDVKLLHYTSIPTQPNHRYARARLGNEGKAHWFPGPDAPHPMPEVTKLFEDEYLEALDSEEGPNEFRVAHEFGNYGIR